MSKEDEDLWKRWNRDTTVPMMVWKRCEHCNEFDGCYWSKLTNEWLCADCLEEI